MMCVLQFGQAKMNNITYVHISGPDLSTRETPLTVNLTAVAVNCPLT